MESKLWILKEKKMCQSWNNSSNSDYMYNEIDQNFLFNFTFFLFKIYQLNNLIGEKKINSSLKNIRKYKKLYERTNVNWIIIFTV